MLELGCNASANSLKFLDVTTHVLTVRQYNPILFQYPMHFVSNVKHEDVLLYHLTKLICKSVTASLGFERAMYNVSEHETAELCVIGVLSGVLLDDIQLLVTTQQGTASESHYLCATDFSMVYFCCYS